MGVAAISSGKHVPEDINVIIEISMNTMPVKYELDKKSGLLKVDRFLSTSMVYPTNYGFVPQTLSDDGDPVDVLVVSPLPLLAGSVIACRCVGMLSMTDESGEDAKILAVPLPKLTSLYNAVHSHADLPKALLQSIEHFFAHYKDLEPGKWVKIGAWHGPEEAKKEIVASVKRYMNHHEASEA